LVFRNERRRAQCRKAFANACHIPSPLPVQRRMVSVAGRISRCGAALRLIPFQNSARALPRHYASQGPTYGDDGEAYNTRHGEQARVVLSAQYPIPY
jgi:hypothetical protein